MPINHDTIHAIQSFTSDVFGDLLRIRRDLHRHPELSGQEAWTAHYLASQLINLGLAVYTNVGGHGLYADLITDPEKPCVALRVDIDALPIQEISHAPYRSLIPGVMHACGHDVHAAIGVGTAAVLSHLQSSLPGNIRFIFQPEEEEITGALRMIRAGVLANPAPSAIFGLHVAPLPVGQIGWTDGLFLGGFEHYLVTLSPQRGFRLTARHLDVVARRCTRAIQRLNQWQMPENWEEMTAFWTLMQSGPAQLRKFIVYESSLNDENPAAWQGQFGLGIKAADPHLRIAALGRVRTALNRICRAGHTRFRLEPMGAMIDMRNDPQLVQSNLPTLEKAVGAHNLIQLKAAFPFNCEDFAYFTRRIPGAMLWLGGANPVEGKFAILHTPDFDVDERCIETGTNAMAAVLVNTLSQMTL